MSEHEPQDAWGSTDDAKWLDEANVAIPLPEEAPWHPCLETLIRAGICVTPSRPPAGGEWWAVGFHEERYARYVIAVLNGPEGPEFTKAFRINPLKVWLSESEFLDGIAEDLGVTEGGS